MDITGLNVTTLYCATQLYCVSVNVFVYKIKPISIKSATIIVIKYMKYLLKQERPSYLPLCRWVFKRVNVLTPANTRHRTKLFLRESLNTPTSERESGRKTESVKKAIVTYYSVKQRANKWLEVDLDCYLFQINITFINVAWLIKRAAVLKTDENGNRQRESDKKC